MDKLIIQGGNPLQGSLAISGSKNSALPILLSCLLIPDRVELYNVPNLRDIHTTLNLLGLFGCQVSWEDSVLNIQSGYDLHSEAPYDLVRTMRASILCLGPLLARLGRAKVALPGGCAIGSRPVDMHIDSLRKMGVTFDLESGYIQGKCQKLHGAHITFDFPTVGGTENLLMAAVMAEGETILENAAREPEIIDLANFLNICGARISGHGTSMIHIRGVSGLQGQTYSIMPDRIEAGTYMVAAAITGGRLTLRNCPLAAMESIINKLEEIGVNVEQGEDELVASAGDNMQGTDVVTQPYPGFPTDMQAQIMALMCKTPGTSTIRETIFENRFMHALELMRLGANIKISGDVAMIRGGKPLFGAPLMASDLRASASLVLAALYARGKTEIRRIYHLDRGYERMEEKLLRVGASIWRVKE